MRVMVIVKASKESEAGVLPSTEIFAKMGQYNEQLVKAGVMLAADGLQPTSKGKRVKFSGERRIVIDGPFTETKEFDSRLLGLAGALDGRGRRMAQARSLRRRNRSRNSPRV